MAGYVNTVRAIVCFELPAREASSFCDFFLLTSCDFIAFISSLIEVIVFLDVPINPILTGGGGGSIWPPPCTKSVTASRPPQIATRLFMTVFFQVLRIFWYQVCENRTIGREVTWRFLLARRHKICPKSAFCICLCTKHMERQKKLVTSSGRCSLKSTWSKLIIFGHKYLKL